MGHDDRLYFQARTPIFHPVRRAVTVGFHASISLRLCSSPIVHCVEYSHGLCSPSSLALAWHRRTTVKIDTIPQKDSRVLPIVRLPQAFLPATSTFPFPFSPDRPACSAGSFKILIHHRAP